MGSNKMPQNTYESIYTTVLSSSATTVTLSPIPQGYTDLVLVMRPSYGLFNGVILRINNDTGQNYSNTRLVGNGSSTTSFSTTTSMTLGFSLDDNPLMSIVNFQNYSSNSSKKSILIKSGNAATNIRVIAAMWNTSSNSPINRIDLIHGDTNGFSVGSTFTLYGIAALSVGAKATGGTIYSSSQYFYHAFSTSGTFTPTQSLTADVLVIGGGGGGGGNGGGGGAGGLFLHSSQPLTATNYGITVGGGGTGGRSSGYIATNGTNSQFSSLTSSVGGGFGATSNIAYSVGSGGSGGGSTNAGTPGTGTSGQGNGGGTSVSTSQYGNGGGGGSGMSGSAGTTTAGGNGGNGTSTYSSWGLEAGFGQNVNDVVYFAGGGAGSVNSGTLAIPGLGGGGTSTSSLSSGVSGNGLINSGSGGGGGGSTATTPAYLGGNGGSGLVIVRYPK
jgi:hypothetical protein